MRNSCSSSIPRKLRWSKSLFSGSYSLLPLRSSTDVEKYEYRDVFTVCTYLCHRTREPRIDDDFYFSGIGTVETIFEFATSEWDYDSRYPTTDRVSRCVTILPLVLADWCASVCPEFYKDTIQGIKRSCENFWKQCPSRHRKKNNRNSFVNFSEIRITQFYFLLKVEWNRINIF